MKILSLIILFILCLLYVFWVCFWPPSDDTLIKRLNAHRTQFDELVKMYQQDPLLKMVAMDWTDPDNPETVGVTYDKIKKYRQLMKAINIGSISKAPHDSTVSLSVRWSKTRKEYWYSTTQPEFPLLKELDTYNPHIPHGNGPAFRKIADNWYIVRY